MDVFGCKAVIGSCSSRDGVGEGVRAGISNIVGLGSNLTCWGRLNSTRNPNITLMYHSPTARGVPLTCVVPPPLGVRHNEMNKKVYFPGSL